MEETGFTLGAHKKCVEDGKALAYELVDKKFSSELADKIDDWAGNVKDNIELIYDDVNRSGTSSELKPYNRFIGTLTSLLLSAYESAEHCTMGSKHGRIVNDKCIITHEGIEDPFRGIIYEGTDDLIGNINVASKSLLGKKCAHGKLGDVYSSGAMIDDIAHCYHELINKFDEDIGEISKRKKVGRCVIDENADKDMIDACEEWNNTVEKFTKNELYTSGDAYPLKAILFGNKGEFTVGDAIGHRTHLNLDKGTVDYYDNDGNVNDVMSKLLGNAGLTCKIRDEGVFCDGLNRDNVRNVATRLSGATSMDFRLSSTEMHQKFWEKSLSEIPELGERCRITSSEVDPIGVETCLIEEKIRAKEINTEVA